MVKQGFSYYSSKRLGRVPVSSVRTLGINLSNLTKEEKTMPKISNIYQDKKSGKWYYVANLGFNEEGKRIRKWGRGFSTQKPNMLMTNIYAYDEYMNDFFKNSYSSK